MIIKRIDKKNLPLLRKIGIDANAMGYTAFLVGGTVRDIILGRKNLDLDITVEGDAIKLGENLAKELGGTLVAHKIFRTCTIELKGKVKLDFATARKEVYEKPAALPKVEPSSLKDDLARRDFTINAMAMSLKKQDFGRLIDFFGGREDLAQWGKIFVFIDFFGQFGNDNLTDNLTA